MHENAEEDIIEVILDKKPSKYKSILDNPEVKKAIEEAKNDWVREVLYYVGLEEDEVYDPFRDSAIDKMDEWDIDIYDRPGDEVIIQQADQDIGEWATPGAEDILIFKDDHDKKWKVHIKLVYWSIVNMEAEEDEEYDEDYEDFDDINDFVDDEYEDY